MNAPTSKIGAYNYLDVSGSVDVKEFLTLRLGVNNLFDKDPPITVAGTFSDCPTGICNGNTYAQVYDTLGRYIYLHASMKF